jgi:hypothetical protein
MISPDEPQEHSTRFVSVEGRVWSTSLLVVGSILTLSAIFTTSVPFASFAEALIALECLAFGIRLFATSSIVVSAKMVQFRTRRLRKMTIPVSEIADAYEASRVLLYKRFFPRLELNSGQKFDLTVFEKSKKRSKSNDSVRSIISLINEVRRSKN